MPRLPQQAALCPTKILSQRCSRSTETFVLLELIIIIMIYRYYENVRNTCYYGVWCEPNKIILVLDFTLC